MHRNHRTPVKTVIEEVGEPAALALVQEDQDDHEQARDDQDN
jgi:hypothetical protein